VTLNAPPPFFEWRGHKNESKGHRCHYKFMLDTDLTFDLKCGLDSECPGAQVHMPTGSHRKFHGSSTFIVGVILSITRGPRGPWVAHLRKRSKVTVKPIIENPRGII